MYLRGEMQVNHWMTRAARVFECSILDYPVELCYKNDMANELASNARDIYLCILRLMCMPSIFPLPLHSDKASHMTKKPHLS